MNGFEPLRRRIIDYTEAGQWSVVYDGPLEDCESERLQAENAKLRELCHDMLAVIIGWSWKLNELAGYRLDDEDTYPSRVMRGFIDRARELEVPL